MTIRKPAAKPTKTGKATKDRTTQTRAPRRPRTPAVDIEQIVLGAATELLGTEGADALSIRRIAAAAGVAPMTLYNRFGSKQGVLDFLFIDGFEALNKALDREPSTDMAHDFIESGRAYRAFALENPTRYMMMFMKAVPDYEPSEQAANTATESFLRLVDMVRFHQHNGRLHAGEDIAIAQEIWSAMHGALSLELMGIGFVQDTAGLVDSICATLTRGLATPTEAANTQPRRTAANGKKKST